MVDVVVLLFFISLQDRAFVPAIGMTFLLFSPAPSRLSFSFFSFPVSRGTNRMRSVKAHDQSQGIKAHCDCIFFKVDRGKSPFDLTQDCGVFNIISTSSLCLLFLPVPSFHPSHVFPSH